MLLDASQVESIHQALMITGNLHLANLVASKAVSSEENKRFVSAVRSTLDDDFTMDENPIVSPSDEGAFVMVWRWVSAEDVVSVGD
jgi:hypothetical protein